MKFQAGSLENFTVSYVDFHFGEDLLLLLFVLRYERRENFSILYEMLCLNFTA